jgi:hypothetical protein
MKKTLFFIVMIAASCKLMAQQAQPSSPKSNLNGWIGKSYEFKADSNKLLPQFKGNYDLQNLASAGNLNNNLLTSRNQDNMPVVVLKGNSKMPVLKPSGNYNLPVAGKKPKQSPDVFVP